MNADSTTRLMLVAGMAWPCGTAAAQSVPLLRERDWAAVRKAVEW